MRALALTVVSLLGSVTAQEPILDWKIDASIPASVRFVASLAEATMGPQPSFVGDEHYPEHNDEHGFYLLLDGVDDALVLSEKAPADVALPKRAMTAAAWVAINTPLRWGGILNVIQDNGNAETGWALGFDEEHFTFGLSTHGADDGDGAMTYLVARSPYRLGRWHHVAATYDGTAMRLFVDGEQQAITRKQTGDILYPKRAPLLIGNYRDDDESHFMHGRVREVTLWDRALSAEEIAQRFAKLSALTQLKPVYDREPAFVVPPYLQRIARDGMTVMWETTLPMTSTVRYGSEISEDQELPQVAADDEPCRIHEVRLEGLAPGTRYFYRVESVAEDGQRLAGDTLTLQTAVDAATPYVFAVLGDTQAKPKVVEVLADRIFAQRPHFLVHAGDLVGDGSDKSHWTKHFFPNMRPLIEHVPFMPVLGNHERNAPHYYRYMSLPDPEYYYEWHYGNSHWFMLDTNKPVAPDSEQYRWLDTALAASKAQWKFAVHHHPIWSSDNNDHGDTAKGESTWGNLNARNLAELYDRHGVDIVWNGHIHVYERTWKVHAGAVSDRNGVIYITSGGGGGGLENFALNRPAFSNTVLRGHHHCLVGINGGTLEFKAYDLEGQLFDTFTLRK